MWVQFPFPSKPPSSSGKDSVFSERGRGFKSRRGYKVRGGIEPPLKNLQFFTLPLCYLTGSCPLTELNRYSEEVNFKFTVYTNFTKWTWFMLNWCISAVCVFLGLFILLVDNLIYGVLCLIGVCFSMLLLLLLHGMDYYGVLLMLVYLGAVAVLFLFIVMLVNVRSAERLQENRGLWFVIMVYIYTWYNILMFKREVDDSNEISLFSDSSNLESLAMVLYGLYGDGIVISGSIILVGVIGSLAIVRKNKRSKKLRV